LQRAVALLEGESLAGAVTGKLYKWNFTTNEKTNILDSTGLCLLRNHRVVDRGENQVDRSQYNGREMIFGVSGAAPVYRRQALESVKIKTRAEHEEYFDEDFFSYKEDLDLAYRLQLAGWSAFYLPSAVAWHDRSLANSQLKKNWQIAQAHRRKNKLVNYLSYRNHLLTLYKNEFRVNILKNILPIVSYEILKWFFMRLFNHLKSQQFKSFWQLYPLMKNKRRQIKKIIQIKPENLRRWYDHQSCSDDLAE
jgi:GT2 family glycosyltransferase